MSGRVVPGRVLRSGDCCSAGFRGSNRAGHDVAGRMSSGAVALAGMVRTATGTGETDVDRMLPVADELAWLLPGRGLRRGSTVSVAPGRNLSAGTASTGLASAGAAFTDAASGGTAFGDAASGGVASAYREASTRRETSAGGWRPAEGDVLVRGGKPVGPGISAGGGTSLMLGLIAAASRNGAWCAVVGVPALGALAAAESGVVLERLALVPEPGPDWAIVVAALIDGVDLVVVAVPGPVSASIVSRLAARARQRGSVLVPFGDWVGADISLQVGSGHWEGLGSGRGRLRRREVTVLARGRGSAARPREITMWMPGTTIRHDPIPPAPPRSEDPAPRRRSRSTEEPRAIPRPAEKTSASVPPTAFFGLAENDPAAGRVVVSPGPAEESPPVGFAVVCPESAGKAHAAVLSGLTSRRPVAGLAVFSPGLVGEKPSGLARAGFSGLLRVWGEVFSRYAGVGAAAFGRSAGEVFSAWGFVRASGSFGAGGGVSGAVV
ncbi:hypothetical protein SAMN04489716_5080 [Actinoplanes derwentensis]|uniref:Uncharacterized protein n=1 Tax=Actinoplanes derwentensis TaxID=113562 RepID=A0A1H2BZP8_9ACTN|nr:hypothetical protein SAMN04489716_5080 [Actinoplanes derwentensis]